MREALVLLEECQRLHRMCRELRGKEALSAVLRNAYKVILSTTTTSVKENENNFSDVLDPPQIQRNYTINNN